jgi:hypothetical protein
MLSLNNSARPLVTLPASAFPARANIYVCDKCGRDLTKQFRPQQSHVWRPLGPERYQCLCGKTYLTGATEWDHFSAQERRRRIGQTLFAGVLFSMMFSVCGLLIYLFLLAFGLRRGAVVTGLVIAALPFSWMQLEFWPSVVASMRRTRVAAIQDVR